MRASSAKIPNRSTSPSRIQTGKSSQKSEAITSLMLVELVSAGEHLLRPLRERLERRDVPAQRVGEAHDHAEQRADDDRVDKRLARHARVEHGARVGGRDGL